MKKRFLLVCAMAVLAFGSMIGCGNSSSSVSSAADSTIKDSKTSADTGEYIDGVYESQSVPTEEGYYGKAKVTVKNGKIADVEFHIVDGNYQNRLSMVTDKDVLEKGKDVEERVFDETYGPDVFAAYPEYLDQCKGDLAGIAKYKEQLTAGKDIQDIDVITGATWSNKIFKNTIQHALEKAQKK